MAAIKVTIDGRHADVAPGATILDAAETLGIPIPTLCHRKGSPPASSCMLCVVKVESRAGLVPSCAAPAEDGMVVHTNTEEVVEARRSALELLLSDHAGDCMGPCHVICPARMNIPLMIRQIAAGSLRDAVVTVKNDIALPACMGRICPAPCEKGCRRAAADAAVAICLLKRYVADVDLASGAPHLPARRPSTGKRVAIIGAGPAGLAAAYYLLQSGHHCALFDEHPKAGGMLQYEVGEERLPRSVLDAEIEIVRRLGAEFRLDTHVGDGISFDDVRRGSDAILIATGPLDPALAARWDLSVAKGGLAVDHAVLRTERAEIFAAGNVVRPGNRLAIRSLADGKLAAVSIDQYLAGAHVVGQHRTFNSRLGALLEGEMTTFLSAAGRHARQLPAGGEERGFAAEEALRETSRCLHCDCRNSGACVLRERCDEYGARQTRYAVTRPRFEQNRSHPDILYEPGKCIDCGACIRIASGAREPLGLSFMGRGFPVRVGVPFDRPLAEGLQKVAFQCADACPTGALSRGSPGKDSLPLDSRQKRG